MTTTLSLAQVAHRAGVTERTVKRRVTVGKHPAPTGFTPDHQPLWTPAIIENPPVMSGPGIKMTREMHLAHLLDEVRWWAWEHPGETIVQAATGRTIAGRPFPLGHRVSALRTQYRTNHLTQDWVDAFEAIPDWTWEPWDQQWNRRFDDIATRYPYNFTEADKSWLAVQRARYEKLRPHWKARFALYPGMIRLAGDSPVRVFVEAARQWLREHPDHATVFSMPFGARVATGLDMEYPVGRRVTYYRRRYAGLEGRNPLPDDDIKLIEALPGWSWEMSPSHVHAQDHRRGRPAKDTINI